MMYTLDVTVRWLRTTAQHHVAIFGDSRVVLFIAFGVVSRTAMRTRTANVSSGGPVRKIYYGYRFN
jgi:hypothetical protein